MIDFRRYGFSLLLCSCSTVVLAAPDNQLVVHVDPPNRALQENIQNHIGALHEQDAAALERRRGSVAAQTLQAAQALGFYNAQIDVQVLRNGKRPAQLTVDVHQGKPVHLRRVNIRVEGPASQVKEFLPPFGPLLKPGAALNQGAYSDIKKLIQNRALRYGFFKGQFSASTLRIDPKAGVADIDLVYASGPRYSFGELTFSGDSPVNDSLLRRMAPYQAGAPYDSQRIAELNQALQSSGYFNSVIVDAGPERAQGTVVPVEVQLRRREPRTLGIGLGYSTDVGPRTRFTWEKHYLNSRGHSLGVEAELSEPKQNVGLWYEVPLDPPLTDKLRYAVGYQYETIADDDSLSKLLTIGPEWRSKLPSGWERVLSLKWRREEYRLGDDSGLSTLLMPGISYSYLRSDNRIDPSQGYRLHFEAAVAKEGMGSDADVVHAAATIKGLTTLPGGHRLLGRLSAGGTEASESRQIPPSLRFFAGGDQSVRGYSYQSLSPENSRGDKIGGRYMLAGSLEYQYPVADKWRLATFVDQGNAYNNPASLDMKTGVGFGVRWVSPVGPIRVDLAHGLQDDRAFMIHFSMGPEL